MSGAEPARRGFVTPQTMNAFVVNLENAGLVVCRSRPEHGRVLRAYLTEAGEELVSGAHRVVEAIEQRMLKELDQDDRLRLFEALRSCADALETGAEGADSSIRMDRGRAAAQEGAGRSRRSSPS